MPPTLPIRIEPADRARINSCVHCGLCLPACPTYAETLNEAESPRGRIHLLRAVAHGLEPTAAVLTHLDSCLLCRACETACPSAVDYHGLVENVRPQIAARALRRPMRDRLLAWMTRHVMPYPRRLAAAILPLRIAARIGLASPARRLARAISPSLGAMADTLPPGPLLPSRPPAFTAAQGQRRGRVLLLLGCVGSVVSAQLNHDCVEVLSRNGFDVHLLDDEPCCGAIAAHGNDPAGAAASARQLVQLLAARGEVFLSRPSPAAARSSNPSGRDSPVSPATQSRPARWPARCATSASCSRRSVCAPPPADWICAWHTTTLVT